ncbi:hypothetical protein [Poseidonocella sedimentorum]|uniref:hypothetical protein n=1 Tax=Poseidonocella sedimentorum TaxID=871652 RepID=UPI000B82E193|nr:hypothetical protein [Poseidonocella sedimentorum]
MNFPDPKEIFDLLGQYAVAGAIVMIGSYGGTLTAGISPLRDIWAFLIVVGVFCVQIFGVCLWLWVYASSAQAFYGRILARHRTAPKSGKLLAWSYTILYGLISFSTGLLLFILAGHQAGIVS